MAVFGYILVALLVLVVTGYIVTFIFRLNEPLEIGLLSILIGGFWFASLPLIAVLGAMYFVGSMFLKIQDKHDKNDL